MTDIPREQAVVLERLLDDRVQNRLVYDSEDKRWYHYDFTSEPPTITDIQTDLAEALLQKRYIEKRGDDQRAALPPSYEVYTATDLAENNLRASRSS
ncbi:MAG: hypothetical protein U5L04_01960 [Trueperaceae bacterium]|nr:hypothetical protein [Trueperaceae bacterium]